MSNYDPNLATTSYSENDLATVDAGLRAFMLRLYNYMALGVGLTGVVAFFTYQFTGPVLLQIPLMWIFIPGSTGTDALYQLVASLPCPCRTNPTDKVQRNNQKCDQPTHVPSLATGSRWLVRSLL